MKFILALTSLAAAFMAVNAVPPVPGELPLTLSNVFVQSGEVTAASALIMVRCNKELNSVARVSYKIQGSSSSPTVVSREAYEANDFTAKLTLSGLTKNTTYDYSVTCTANADGAVTTSRPASFKTLPAATDEVELSFVWAADLAGQGWGRNPDLNITTVGGKLVKGGYLVFEVMGDLKPDFALFQGDMIYADNAIPPNKTIPATVGGGLYINNPSKDYTAVTLDQFRGNWKYNFGDEKMQTFLSKTPVYVQWDDHEVTNNWYPTEIINSSPYLSGTSVDSLYENSLQAFYEYNPLPDNTVIYRSHRFGKHLEIFFPDLRTFRAPNPRNSDTTIADMMGPTQLAWLKDRLLRSTATHKLLSMHDPVGLTTGGPGDYDSYGNGNNANLGRELELQDLLGYIKARNIRNVNVLTSDVHHAAFVNYDPSRATGGFTAFTPFDEYVIGAIHSGAFGPNSLDNSFGPRYGYVRGPASFNGQNLGQNLPPPNLVSFGHVRLTKGGDLTISIVDITGAILYNKTYVNEPELPVTTTDVFVQSGEISSSSAVLMARCNKEQNSQVTFTYRVGTSGAASTIVGSVTSASDYTISVRAAGLTSGTGYTFNASCVGTTTTNSVVASFKTANAETSTAPIKFVWAADLAGQGWCRWPDLKVTTVSGATITGGYPIFETMKSFNPDFAVFQGDLIYADNNCNPMAIMPEEVGGAIWYNNPSKPFAAVSLSEFRFNWKYNHGDDKMQSFLAQTPIFVQWDDHEVTNNWYPGEIIGAPQYPNNTSVDLMAINARRAFYEFNPLMPDQLIYRTQRFGKHLEVFFVDMRSYRAANTLASNKGNVAMFGEPQLTWLLNALRASSATWKILSMHDPISIITGGPGDYDAFGQDKCPVLARENELATILKTVKDNKIKNVVSITSDVHFSAAISYNPVDAVFKEFDPFFEFVIGPIHSGAFGPGELDGTFGPNYDFLYAPGTQGFRGGNLPPPFLSTFGMADVTSAGNLEAKIVSVTGAVLYSKTLTPAVETPDPCTVSLDIFNAATNAKTVTVPSNGVVTGPPCEVNIEVKLACTPPFTFSSVYIELMSGSSVVKFRNETKAPWFLFGDAGTDVLAGVIPSGSFTVRTTVNGTVLKPRLLNMGSCV